MIPREQITLQSLTDMLDGAAIDWTQHDDSSIYVTSLAFNFWVSIDTDHAYICYNTHWPVQSDANRIDVLSYVNRCNEKLALAQFWFCEGTGRLRAHYCLPFREGLAKRQFLRTAHQFGDTFAAAAHREDNDDVLRWHQPDGDETAVPSLLN